MIFNTFIKALSPCSNTKKIKYDIEIMNWYHNNGFHFFAKQKQNSFLRKYSCEIERGVEIDKTVKFQHLVGIVIGNKVKLGKHVIIHQGVTLGANVGADFKGSKELMPTIHDYVCIFSGAVVAGGINIGQGSIIGANSIVTVDIPENSLVTGFNQIKPLKRDTP